MLEKNSKISVLQKVIGLGKKRSESPMVVPQNSLTQIRQKLGLLEYETLSGQRPNSFQTQAAKAAYSHCPHCENMAKNFLYLESLVRSNFLDEDKCALCNATLKYLQYVNKNIAEVFGNFDSIVQASRAFTIQAKGNSKQHPAYPTATRPRSNVEAKKQAEDVLPKKTAIKKGTSKGTSKGKTVKMELQPQVAKANEAPVKRMTGGGADKVSSDGALAIKRSKIRSKLRKAPKKSSRSVALKRRKVVSQIEKEAKVVLKKQKPLAKHKLKASSHVLGAIKSKVAKIRQIKSKKSSMHVKK